MIKERILIGEHLSLTDISQYYFIVGHRKKKYTVLDSFFLKNHLKFFLDYFISYSKNQKFLFFFFHSCEDTVFLKDLDQIFKDRGNISLIRYKDPQSLEYIKEIAFLATNKTGLVITFLDLEEMLQVKKETVKHFVPTISFTNQKIPYFYTDIQILGNFDKSSVQQHFIHLIILLYKKVLCKKENE